MVGSQVPKSASELSQKLEKFSAFRSAPQEVGFFFFSCWLLLLLQFDFSPNNYEFSSAVGVVIGRVSMQRISVLISLVIVLQCLSLVVDCADYVQPSLDRPLFYSFVGHPEREEAYNLLVAQELEEREKSDAVHNASSGTLAREVSPPQFNCPKINCHKASSATTIRALTACDIAVIGRLAHPLPQLFFKSSETLIFSGYKIIFYRCFG